MSDRSVRRGAWVAVAASLLFAGLILCGGGFGREIKWDGESDAYTRFVREQFIDHPGRLVVREDVDQNAGVPIVDLTPAVYNGKDPQAWRFATQSFLLEDIRRNDPSIWLIENGRVRDINGRAHQTPLPFADRRAWRGSVLFREAPATTPQQRDVVLQPRGWNGPRLRLTYNRGDLTTGDARIHVLRLDSAGDGEIAAPAIDIYCSAADLDPVARLRRIGDQAGVWANPDKGCGVRVGLDTLRKGGFDAIGQGDRLALETTLHTYAFDRVAARDGEPALSAPTPSGDRVRDPSTPWWAIAIEHDYVRSSLLALSDPSLRKDMRTTLDPELQPGVQAMLDKFIADHPGTGEIPLKIAAVTVMDAQSGEVLAMATWPHVAPSPHDVVDLDDEAAKAARLNQNLQLLPIGSTAKPLVASAIFTQSPELIGLRTPSRLKATELMGMDLRSPVDGEVEGGLVDFDEFIRRSDNVYAANLLLLGSKDRGNETCSMPVADAYFVGAVQHNERPKSVFEASDGHGGCTRAAPQSERQLRWADAMADLFDVNVSARGFRNERYVSGCVNGGSNSWGGGRYGDDLHEVSGWRLLFEQRPRLNVCGFAESAPIREALAITAAKDFRSDLLPIMLGNGEGRWTAVKLAESYSRLVIGRRIVATFALGPRQSFLPMDPRFTTRAQVTHALTLVPKGTARETRLPAALVALAQRVHAAGRVPGFFAKTGTPVAIKTDYSPVDKAINLLISQERLRYLAKQGSIAIDPVGKPSVVLSPTADRATINQAVSALAADAGFKEAAIRFHVRAGAVVAALSGYTRQIAQGHMPFVVTRDGLLVRMGARRDDNGNLSDDDLPHGKLLVLVAAAYDPKTLRAPLVMETPNDGRAADGMAYPVRAYTIVVTIQYPIKSTNAAADLAADIAQRYFGDRLTGAASP
jgi:hypothetical protein